jgi:hypothetical protein
MQRSLTREQIARLCAYDPVDGVYTLDFSIIPSWGYRPLFRGLHRFIGSCGPHLIFQCSKTFAILPPPVRGSPLSTVPSIAADPGTHRFVHWLMLILRRRLPRNQNVTSLGLCDLPEFNVDTFIRGVLIPTVRLIPLILEGVPIDSTSLKSLLLATSPFRYEEIRLCRCGLGSEDRMTVYTFLKSGRSKPRNWTLMIFDVSQNLFSDRDLLKFEELLERRTRVDTDFRDEPAQDGEEEDQIFAEEECPEEEEEHRILVTTLSDVMVDQLIDEEFDSWSTRNRRRK